MSEVMQPTVGLRRSQRSHSTHRPVIDLSKVKEEQTCANTGITSSSYRSRFTGRLRQIQVPITYKQSNYRTMKQNLQNLSKVKEEPIDLCILPSTSKSRKPANCSRENPLFDISKVKVEPNNVSSISRLRTSQRVCGAGSITMPVESVPRRNRLIRKRKPITQAADTREDFLSDSGCSMQLSTNMNNPGARLRSSLATSDEENAIRDSKCVKYNSPPGARRSKRLSLQEVHMNTQEADDGKPIMMYCNISRFGNVQTCPSTDSTATNLESLGVARQEPLSEDFSSDDDQPLIIYCNVKQGNSTSLELSPLIEYKPTSQEGIEIGRASNQNDPKLVIQTGAECDLTIGCELENERIVTSKSLQCRPGSAILEDPASAPVSQQEVLGEAYEDMPSVMCSRIVKDPTSAPVSQQEVVGEDCEDMPSVTCSPIVKDPTLAQVSQQEVVDGAYEDMPSVTSCRIVEENLGEISSPIEYFESQERKFIGEARQTDQSITSLITRTDSPDKTFLNSECVIKPEVRGCSCVGDDKKVEMSPPMDLLSHERSPKHIGQVHHNYTQGSPPGNTLLHSASGILDELSGFVVSETEQLNSSGNIPVNMTPVQIKQELLEEFLSPENKPSQFSTTTEPVETSQESNVSVRTGAQSFLSSDLFQSPDNDDVEVEMKTESVDCNESDFVYSSDEANGDISNSESECEPNFFDLPVRQYFVYNPFYKSVHANEDVELDAVTAPDRVSEDEYCLDDELMLLTSDSDLYDRGLPEVPVVVPNSEDEQDPRLPLGMKRCDLEDIANGMYDVFDCLAPHNIYPSGSEWEVEYDSSECSDYEDDYNQVIMVTVPSGETYKINIDQVNPPTFDEVWVYLIYEKAVRTNASKLKKRLTDGSYSIEEYCAQPEERLETKTLREEDRVQRIARYSKSVTWFYMSLRVIQIHDYILGLAHLERFRLSPDTVLIFLEEMSMTNLDALVLARHPEVVRTVCLLREYVGNCSCWNFTPEELLTFTGYADRTRIWADKNYRKFKKIYGVATNAPFWGTYSAAMEQFRAEWHHWEDSDDEADPEPAKKASTAVRRNPPARARSPVPARARYSRQAKDAKVYKDDPEDVDDPDLEDSDELRESDLTTEESDELSGSE